MLKGLTTSNPERRLVGRGHRLGPKIISLVRRVQATNHGSLLDLKDVFQICRRNPVMTRTLIEP